MKLKRELNKNLGSSMQSKILLIAAILIAPAISKAEPVIGDIPMPPASFTRVTDPKILDDLGLDIGGAWCYDDAANAVLITAPARERAHCELKIMYEIERLRVSHKFETDKLKLRIDTLIDQHTKLDSVKDAEIDRLTEAALKRPNDYSHWWATGGFATGVLATVLVMLAL